MNAEMVFRFILIGIGVGALAVAVLALAGRKMTETFCMIWGFFGLILILAGLLLHPSGWRYYLSREGLLLVVLAGICLLTVAYFVSAGVSELLRRTREAAMQIALLRLENEELERGEREQKKKELLVIMPAYNEEGNIGGLLEQMEREDIREFADLLVIDDGSFDHTGQIAEELRCVCVRGIFHQGYGSALQTGYKYAVRKGYSYIIQMDADGQHDISNVRALYEALREKDGKGGQPDIVLGSRFLSGSRSFPVSGSRLLAIRLFRWILRMTTGQRITDPTTGLQGLNRRTFSFYSRYGCFDNEYPDANVIMQMLYSGYKIREIPALMHARRTGKGMHSGLKPLAYMFRMAFSMTAVYIRVRLLRMK